MRWPFSSNRNGNGKERGVRVMGRWASGEAFVESMDVWVDTRNG